MNYSDFFRRQLDELRAEGRYRVFADLERQAGSFPRAKHHTAQGARPVSVWCSNDYLGMGQHPLVLQAMHEALDRCGAGAGGTRNIAGTNHYHVLLERELADLHGKESALLFTSGYVSNWATLGTLASRLPGCVVLSDAHNHASMIEGIRHSRAETRIFAHNDPADLARQLKDVEPSRAKLVAFESVYSMDGDTAPISDICDVAEAHGAMTYLDEVHAVGLARAAAASRSGQSHRLTVIEGTLAKALAWSAVTSPHRGPLRFIRASLRGLFFTTALPPSNAAGALASIATSKQAMSSAGSSNSVSRLKQRLDEARVPYGMTVIVPVMVRDPVLCKQISDRLLDEHGIYVQPINYPTVARGSERLRITPSPLHGEAEIDHLAACLASFWKPARLFGLAGTVGRPAQRYREMASADAAPRTF